MSFTNLHVHTQWSLLDGLSAIPELVSKAKAMGQSALAITDHGNMFGAVKFYKECKKQGIKPIIGCEVYTAERNKEDKDASLDRKIGHLILLCKDEKGYRNLIKIVSDAYTDGFYYKPRTDKKALREHHEGLICLSGCLAGKTQRLLLEGDYEGARAEALDLRDIFGEDFYLELQNHHLPEDNKVISGIYRLSKETGIKTVITNDSHYTDKKDAYAQEVLMCIQTKQTMSEKHMSFGTDEFYLKSESEMRELFPLDDKSIEETGKIAEKCNFDFRFGEYKIPSFDIPAPFKTSEEYFRHLCEKGYAEKYKDAPEIRDRLSYEIKTICDMGYIEYFLIVQDFINWAKGQGIFVGPGRGSACGSVVSYCLGITEIDPLKYDLVFERFLNPERVSMPDIDVDFCIKRRHEVIEYVTEKYGKDCVCQISTTGTLKAKAAIKDVARVLEYPFADANRLSKLVPDDLGITIKEALEREPDLEALYAKDEKVKKIIDVAMRLEGNPRHVSTHAAGVVISSSPITDTVPVVSSEKGLATQYNMVEIEELGMLKMDFLGLRNLTVIQETLEQLKEKGINLDLNSLTFDDPNVYSLISQGRTSGVFQLESKGISDFMKRLKPERFEDIIAGVALYRPGPMDSIPQYIKNRKSKFIRYGTPKLKPILDVTYGVTIYQEQVMRIVRDLAGYSYGRSDLVRRAMSKKKHDVMLEEKEYFIHGLEKDGEVIIPGCVRNGIREDVAEKIYDDMISFAEYAFNKSHAAAYSVITYWTAYLKRYFPSEFFAALMTSVEGDSAHIDLFAKDAESTLKADGSGTIKVLPPDIFRSHPGFSVDEDGNILFGLGAVKNVGSALADAIYEMDKTDLEGNFPQFIKRIPQDLLDTRSIEYLIKSGALKKLIPNVKSGLYALESTVSFVRDLNKKAGFGQISLFDTDMTLWPEVKKYPEFDEPTRLSFEKDALGIYLTSHPLNGYRSMIRSCCNLDYRKLKSEGYKGDRVTGAGVVVEIKKITTKKKERMAFVTCETLDGNVDLALFPQEYEMFSTLTEDEKICFRGKADGDSIVIENILPISMLEVLKKTPKESGRTVKIKVPKVTDELLKVLERYSGGPDTLLVYDGSGQPRRYKNKIYCSAMFRKEIEACGVTEIKVE